MSSPDCPEPDHLSTQTYTAWSTGSAIRLEPEVRLLELARNGERASPDRAIRFEQDRPSTRTRMAQCMGSPGHAISPDPDRLSAQTSATQCVGNPGKAIRPEPNIRLTEPA